MSTRNSPKPNLHQTTTATSSTSLPNSTTTLSQRHSSAIPEPLATQPRPPNPDILDKRKEREMAFGYQDLSRKSQWIALAIMSGACAAFNGVFAKLTTTELTTTFSAWISSLFGKKHGSNFIEVIVRGLFFTLNLLFNFIMWTLFTKALAHSTSSTRVSILNTSTNFLITAILGFIIFSESLPPLWFLGAGFLVAGNVIIGRRDEGDEKPGEEGRSSSEGGVEGEGLLGEDLELEDESEEGRVRDRKRREREVEEEDVLDLGDEGRASEDLMDLRH